MATNLILSQSNYPLKTIIKGDSVVILEVSQADEINRIFSTQKETIAKNKIELGLKDSIIKAQNSEILILKAENDLLQNRSLVEVKKELDTIRKWLFICAVANSWIYYSFIDSSVYAVDLSMYRVRKDDKSGDLFFYRITEDCPFEENDEKEPRMNWWYEIKKEKRPKVKKIKI